MRTRDLGGGGGGPAVPVVGCGDVSLAQAATRGLDSSDVERALNTAIELGVGVIDVADDAHGDSARLVGDVVRAQRARDRVVVATHVTRLAVRGSGDDLPRALPVKYVIERVDMALRASKLDALHLAQLPLAVGDRSSRVAWDDMRAACDALVQGGKVLRWGVVLDGAEHLAPPDRAPLLELIDAGWFACVQLTLNACQRAAGPLIDELATRKLAVLARRVLAGGTLAGTIGPGVKLSMRDDRRALDDAALERVAVGVAELAALVSHVPPAARSCDPARARLEARAGKRPDHIECSTVAELALRYAIDRPGVTCALVRLHRHTHVTEAVMAAVAPPLSADLMKRLDSLDI